MLVSTSSAGSGAQTPNLAGGAGRRCPACAACFGRGAHCHQRARHAFAAKLLSVLDIPSIRIRILVLSPEAHRSGVVHGVAVRVVEQVRRHVALAAVAKHVLELDEGFGRVLLVPITARSESAA